MKGQVYLISALIFTIIIALFSVFNVSKVKVNYLLWSGESPLIIVILFSVLLGCVLTSAVGGMKYLHLKREHHKVIEKVKKYETELGIESTIEADKNTASEEK